MGFQEHEHQQGKPASAASPPPAAEAAALPPKRRHPWQRRLRLLGVVLLVYLALAYFLIPVIWKSYARRHPALDDMPRMTRTGSDIPGDPLNIALVGTEEQVKKIMLAANWRPADPLTLRSCLGIASASVLRRSYESAPVSNLYLWGRKQDLAFEKPAGADPRQRHHVRFWRSETTDSAGRPLWAGAATFDQGVGFSHTTGQITHHIAPDVDEERERLLRDLAATGDLAEVLTIEGFHSIREGKNGGGDRWRTDGNLPVGYLRAAPGSLRP